MHLGIVGSLFSPRSIPNLTGKQVSCLRQEKSPPFLLCNHIQEHKESHCRHVQRIINPWQQCSYQRMKGLYYFYIEYQISFTFSEEHRVCNCCWGFCGDSTLVFHKQALLKCMINLNYQWVCEFTFPTLFDWHHSEISHGKEAEQCLHMDMPLL